MGRQPKWKCLRLDCKLTDRETEKYELKTLNIEIRQIDNKHEHRQRDIKKRT
jgi:hypothetical protein